MSILGNLFSGGAGELVKNVGGVIDNLHTSKKEKLEAEQKIKSGNTTRLYMVECSFTKATKHIAFVFKTGSQGVQNPQLYIESFIEIVRNRIKSMVD